MAQPNSAKPDMDRDVSLSSDILSQLNTTEAKALHDIGDSLSACGVGRIVNLPQIIVVGEQSSGKSSVLEAISHVRFPVEGGLCTRFATELVLRPAEETRVDVSVKFAEKGKVSKSFRKHGFREEDLPGIIDEAKGHMGFGGGGEDKRFSKDVLRLEIQGPKMYPLSLVDLPGLFHNLTETQSSADKAVVDELVGSYMRQKNSIILVVITANNQLASHIALNRVKQVDPQGLRTLGVITKPDLNRPGWSDEKMYVRVAKNQEAANRLQLGWHVLRNRAEDETSLDQRDEIEEAFFKTGAWASIPPDDRGIESLRRKLSHVLYSHIRNGLPGVIADIEQGLRDRQEELQRLGRSRATQEDMRSFLLSIASEYQRLTRDAIDGRYNDPFFGGLDDEERKLRAQLRNFNRAFDYILRTRGATRVITTPTSPSRPEATPKYLESFMERNPCEFPVPVPVSREVLKTVLQNKAAANQGREFPGSANKDLVIQLFKEQAEPWTKIADHHIKRVALSVKAFVDNTFEHIAGQSASSRTTEAILATCVDPFFDEKEAVLQEKVHELLRPYTQGFAMPLDVEFYRDYSQKSMEALADQVEGILRDRYPLSLGAGPENKLDSQTLKHALSSAQTSGSDEFGIDTIVDMMMVYYDVSSPSCKTRDAVLMSTQMSRRTFTDNVINLAIESCLVSYIPEILTPAIVDSMSMERLQELAAESKTTAARRQILQEELDVLRQGLERCRRYRPRPATGKQVAATKKREKIFTRL